MKERSAERRSKDAPLQKLKDFTGKHRKEIIIGAGFLITVGGTVILFKTNPKYAEKTITGLRSLISKGNPYLETSHNLVNRLIGVNMGRRKNNPALVQELISNRWNLEYENWDEKYYSLSSGDMSKVSNAVNNMEAEYFNGHDDANSGERLNVYDAADIWMSNGKDEDYRFGYTERELENAL